MNNTPSRISDEGGVHLRHKEIRARTARGWPRAVHPIALLLTVVAPSNILGRTPMTSSANGKQKQTTRHTSYITPLFVVVALLSAVLLGATTTVASLSIACAQGTIKTVPTADSFMMNTPMLKGAIALQRHQESCAFCCSRPCVLDAYARTFIDLTARTHNRIAGTVDESILQYPNQTSPSATPRSRTAID